MNMPNPKISIVVIIEAGLSWWLASVGNQMQVDPKNVTLGVIKITTDLSCVAMLISCVYRIQISVYLCEILI